MGNYSAQIYRERQGADAATAFKETVSERRTLANSAKHKKGGSKMVRLPSDGMTRKEWEARNGEVNITMTPIGYDDFISKPKEFQARYIKWLHDEFELTVSLINATLGNAVSTQMLSLHMTKLRSEGYDVGRYNVKRISDENRHRWRRWMLDNGQNPDIVLKYKSHRRSKMSDACIESYLNNEISIDQLTELIGTLNERSTMKAVNAYRQRTIAPGVIDCKVPVDIATFNHWNDETQAAYLHWMVMHLNANATCIAKMLGIDPIRCYLISRHLYRRGLLKRALSMANMMTTDAWYRWIAENSNGSASGAVPAEPENIVTTDDTGADVSMAHNNASVQPSETEVESTRTAVGHSVRAFRTICPNVDGVEKTMSLITWVKAGLKFYGDRKITVTLTIEGGEDTNGQT